MLDRQPLTLLVAVLTLAFTVLLYYEIPKGFFPVQDTGMIQAITEASQSVSYQQMATLQNQLAEAVLKDPDVVNLSSYVGVDGTNQTLNTGRFLISLKPHDERSLQRQRDHPAAAERGRRRDAASRSTCSRCRT